jgi:ABC-type bacteriocin/lantibiotic exporter with double-glycine peptidase domain
MASTVLHEVFQQVKTQNSRLFLVSSVGLVLWAGSNYLLQTYLPKQTLQTLSLLLLGLIVNLLIETVFYTAHKRNHIVNVALADATCSKQVARFWEASLIVVFIYCGSILGLFF